MEIDERYMRRALELAAHGRGFTAPNPMVGAVIVAPDGRVIGEGWHRRCGEAHAEVNAVNAVSESDLPLLSQSTIYVTLEPCSHYGKTPPCSKLLIDKHIPRVVVGAVDPNAKVNGRGIAMLREAGAEVVTGVLARESMELNKVFFTSQMLRRPFITLKWAQTADGFMDCVRSKSGGTPLRISTDYTSLTTMKLRSEHEAILTTATTALADNPRLTLRGWPGREPKPFVLDRSDRLSRRLPDCKPAICERAEIISPVAFPDLDFYDIAAPFRLLYEKFGITSVLVEAGPRYLSALLEAGMWDELRVEVSPERAGESGMHEAPAMPVGKLRSPSKPDGFLKSTAEVDGNHLFFFANDKSPIVGMA